MVESAHERWQQSGMAPSVHGAAGQRTFAGFRFAAAGASWHTNGHAASSGDWFAMITAAQVEAVVAHSLGCAPDVAAAVGARARLRQHPARATIIWQGAHTAEAFLLIDGLAHAVVIAANGQEVVLQAFRPGDLFGEDALVDDAVAKSGVVAAQASASAGFAVKDFVVLMEAHGCIGVAVSRAMIARSTAMARRMVAVSILSATGRICAELARRGRAVPEGVLRPIPVWSELAREVQSTRETVSRTVADLKRRGIVRQEGDALVIAAPRMLDEMVI